MANERDFIWQQQGASSFVKIKMDWARFGKIHFSFVQHSGKPACKQVASIEAALKVDGGDGALYLAEAVKNNTMERRRAKALEDQKASGAKIPGADVHLYGWHNCPAFQNRTVRVPSGFACARHENRLCAAGR